MLVKASNQFIMFTRPVNGRGSVRKRVAKARCPNQPRTNGMGITNSSRGTQSTMRVRPRNVTNPEGNVGEGAVGNVVVVEGVAYAIGEETATGRPQTTKRKSGGK